MKLFVPLGDLWAHRTTVVVWLRHGRTRSIVAHTCFGAACDAGLVAGEGFAVEAGFDGFVGSAAAGLAGHCEG